jgi:hypothetical protein
MRTTTKTGFIPRLNEKWNGNPQLSCVAVDFEQNVSDGLAGPLNVCPTCLVT